MATKSDFLTAIGATLGLGNAPEITFTNATNIVNLTAHGLETGMGPMLLSSDGDLPAELGPNKSENGLTFTPGTIADDVVEVNGVYYAFAADPTTGTPDGSVGDPYLVDVGGTDTISLANLVKAINATGVGGTDYSAEIVAPHATVEATASDATTLSLRALVAGVAGDAFTLSVAGDDGLAADSATFSGGSDSASYWAIVVDDDTFQLATTRANALAGTAVAITDDGTGTHTTQFIAQSLADRVEDVINDVLTFGGNRSNDPAVNESKAWQAMIDSITLPA